MDPGEPLGRAWGFERAMQDRCARSRRAFDYGTALFNDSLRRVYDANFVRFERGFEELTAVLVATAADMLQAGLGHRKVVIPDEDAGARVAEELKRSGWRYYRLVTMAYRGPRPRAAPSAAEQVSNAAIREAREHALVDGTRDPDARRQIVEFTELMASAVSTRMIAARARDGGARAGEIGAFCALFQSDGVGQIDEVTTIDRHRRRGLGGAVVEGAIAASLAAGDDLTFVVADEADWPREWYARLGFEPVGHRYELLRT
jgi:ribosomal protein S18 acetylase RimI-like enzyme